MLHPKVTNLLRHLPWAMYDCFFPLLAALPLR